MSEELISIDLSPETEEEGQLIEDLIQYRKAKRVNALRSVITGKTPETDEDGNKIVRKRESRGAGKVDYIPGWWFVDQMNALFGHCWNQEVKDFKVDWERKMVYVLVRAEVVRPGYSEIIVHTDGTRVEKRFDEVRIGHTQFGSSDIKTYASDAPIANKKTGEIKGYKHKSGDVIDIADDLKSATTDGMKKACSWFGIGADVYGRREDTDVSEEEKEKSQYDILYKTGEKKGWSREKVDSWVAEVTGHPIDNLPQHKVLSLIDKIRTSP